MCIFATAYKRKVSCFARKALRYCPLSGIRQNSYGRIEHFRFRLLYMQLALTPTAYPQA